MCIYVSGENIYSENRILWNIIKMAFEAGLKCAYWCQTRVQPSLTFPKRGFILVREGTMGFYGENRSVPGTVGKSKSLSLSLSSAEELQILKFGFKQRLVIHIKRLHAKISQAFRIAPISRQAYGSRIAQGTSLYPIARFSSCQGQSQTTFLIFP